MLLWARFIPTVVGIGFVGGERRERLRPGQERRPRLHILQAPSHLVSSLSLADQVAFLMDGSRSGPNSTYSMILPIDPESEESPSLTLFREHHGKVSADVIMTPQRSNGSDHTRHIVGRESSGSRFLGVTKMIADMIWGPAFIVIAPGKTARLIVVDPPVLACFQGQ